MPLCNVLLILSDLITLELLDTFSKNTYTSNFTNIRPVNAEFFGVDGKA